MEELSYLGNPKSLFSILSPFLSICSAPSLYIIEKITWYIIRRQILKDHFFWDYVTRLIHKSERLFKTALALA